MQQVNQPVSFQQLFGTRPDATQAIGARPPSQSTYDQATIIRMGNQIAGILVDNAIVHDNATVQLFIRRCVALGVTTPRGINCVVVAYQGDCRADLDRVALLVEAVLWELSASGKYPSTKRDIDNSSTGIAAIIGFRPLDNITLEHVQTATQHYLRDMIQHDTPTEPKSIKMLELSENHYRSLKNDDELVVAREFGIHPKSQMPMQGMWVLRNYHTGEFIDSDRYINDLTERNHLDIYNT